jgi:hypothetical protein
MLFDDRVVLDDHDGHPVERGARLQAAGELGIEELATRFSSASICLLRRSAAR